MQVENDEEPEEHVPVLAAVGNRSKHGMPSPITGDRLAIDEAGARLVFHENRAGFAPLAQNSDAPAVKREAKED